MTTATKPITAEELLEMDSDQPCELVEGQLHMMTPAGHQHSQIGIWIGAMIVNHIKGGDLGAVSGADGGFRIARDPDTVLAPDVAFVAKGRRPEPIQGYYEGAPDLAVEIASPSDRAKDVEAKAGRWLAAGTRVVWVVWPDTRTVTIHRPDARPQTLREEDTLTADDVLAGFRCSVGELFV